jgi:DNA-binding transcriptional ArsR family regulator
MIVAIAHPLRRRILHLVHDRGEPVSPVQISRELHEPLSAIIYHSTILRKLGALEPAGERQVRGAIEHFYKSTIENDPPIEALLEETRELDEEE